MKVYLYDFGLLTFFIYWKKYKQLSSELQKLEQVKLKSAQNIRRRNEITEEMALI